jgi:uncharacterized protein (TIGR00369 family)
MICMDNSRNGFPENALDFANRLVVGLNKLVGLRFIKATSREIVSEMKIENIHHQAYGIVHGGVYASMVEATCSAGAAISVSSEKKSTVGIENNTSFLRAVRSGKLSCLASPILKGRRSHVWAAKVINDTGQLVAIGQVRLLVLEPGSMVDGVAVSLNTS